MRRFPFRDSVVCHVIYISREEYRDNGYVTIPAIMGARAAPAVVAALVPMRYDRNAAGEIRRPPAAAAIGSGTGSTNVEREPANTSENNTIDTSVSTNVEPVPDPIAEAQREREFQTIIRCESGRQAAARDVASNEARDTATANNINGITGPNASNEAPDPIAEAQREREFQTIIRCESGRQAAARILRMDGDADSKWRFLHFGHGYLGK